MNYRDYLSNIGDTPYTCWYWFVEPVKQLTDAVVRGVRVDLGSRCVTGKMLNPPRPFAAVDKDLREWAAGRMKR